MKEGKCVLFLDSGVGGLSTLFETKKLLKKQNFVYVADFLNAPFGTKSKKELTFGLKNTLTKLCKKFNPQCIVLACNTATAVAAQNLRASFSQIIVGTEPAILPALRQGFQKILVLCTPSTKKHSKLLKENKNNSKLVFCCPKKLATLVDENFENLNKLKPYVSKLLKKFSLKIDAVVLGCTHYVFVKGIIQEVLPHTTIFDGNFGVAKQVKRKISGFKSENPKMIFVSTQKSKQKFLEKVAQKMFKID